MKALEYILKNYQKSEDESDGPVLRALLHALSPEELKTLQRKIVLCGRYSYYYSDELYEQADRVLKRNNESVTVLLKNFESKDQVTRLDARYRLRDRFGEQSKVIQTKILKAFSHGSEEDRNWFYLHCGLQYWDDSLEKDVKFLWDKYRKYRKKSCAKIIARIIVEHFPVDYLIENIESLYPDDNYEILCIRLRNHPSFNVEFDRLHKRYGDYDVGYIYILANSNSTIEKGKASQILYKLIVHFINENKSIPNIASFNSFLRFGEVSTTIFSDVELVLCCMGKLGLVDEILSYKRWDKKVTQLYNRRKDLWEKEEPFLKEEQQWKLYYSVIAECMPKEYKGLISSYVRSASATLPTFED